MTATVAGIHLGLDTHANRPAANTAPDGSFYSCSTHGLIYKSNFAGNSWATWATLGTAGAIVDPMTTRGDIIVRNSSNVTARLAVGAAGKFLSSDGTDAAWGQGPLTTTGDLLIGASGGTPTRLAAGATSGHVLTSNGSGAAPSWQAAAGGGGSGALILLEQHTASASASLDFTTGITSTYDEYILEMIQLRPATNGVVVLLRVSTDGGSSFVTANDYKWAAFRASHAGSASSGSNATDAIALDGVGTVSNSSTKGGFNGSCRIFNPLGGSMWTRFKYESGIDDDSGTAPSVVVMGTAAYAQVTAVNAIRVYMSSGNITSGVARLYGIAKT